MPLGIIGTYLLFCDGIEPRRPIRVGCAYRSISYSAPRAANCSHLANWLGLTAGRVIALPWYIAVAVQTHGEWITGFLGKHNVGRFMQPMEHHRGLPVYYVVAILVGFFPGSVFLPVGLWSMISSVRRKAADHCAAAFLLCWIGCYVGFFTLAATKLPNYVVPCYSALAIATAYWLSAAIRHSSAHGIGGFWAGYGSLLAVGVWRDNRARCRYSRSTSNRFAARADGCCGDRWWNRVF